jgi:hypothetical protein
MVAEWREVAHLQGFTHPARERIGYLRRPAFQTYRHEMGTMDAAVMARERRERPAGSRSLVSAVEDELDANTREHGELRRPLVDPLLQASRLPRSSECEAEGGRLGTARVGPLSGVRN